MAGVRRAALSLEGPLILLTPDRAAAVRLAGPLMLEQNGERAGSRRHTPMESLKPVRDEDGGAAMAAAAQDEPRASRSAAATPHTTSRRAAITLENNRRIRTDGTKKNGSEMSAGGGTGIRTLGRVAPTTVFETAPFDHSGTPPHLGAWP